jgi:hypothetical protein
MKHTRTGATGKASFFTPKDTSIFCNLRFYYLLNGPKKEINNQHTPTERKHARTATTPIARKHARARARKTSLSLSLSFFLFSSLRVRARVARESSTNLEAHTHTRDRERERERERRGNMVKVAKTARTFDAVREFVVGFLSFYSLSLSLSRHVASRRSRSRVSVCGALTVSLSLSLSRFVSNAKTV